MLLDLEAQEQGEWFQFFTSHIDEATGEVIYDEPSPDARVKIRSMVPFIEERLASRKRQYEHVLNPKTRSMERISYYPEMTPEENRKDREDTWDYVIQGLEGFADKKTGKEIACTRENKIKLMKLPVFDRFVARCLQLLSSSGVEEQEIKNSLTGSSSATTRPDPE
jgi:hypothetical protein